MNNELIKMIETSFLAPLLQKPNVTDIYYNGQGIYFMTNNKGRSYFTDISSGKVSLFIRQIANMTNKLFSYQNPYLDVSIGKYRLSAVHGLISRSKEGETITFAMRITSLDKDLLINNNFFNEKSNKVIEKVLALNTSIVIIGVTGSGKTTLQKYLIGKLKQGTRIVIIDNGLELNGLSGFYSHLDISMWEYDEIKDSTMIASLIRVALRFNIDYLIIAESRGNELLLMYEASLSGHATILTLHAGEVELVYARMEAMLNYAVAKEELAATFPVIILVDKKNSAKGVCRFLKKIAVYQQKTKKFTYLFNNEEE